MKKTLTILFCLFTITIFGQTNQSFSLKWKIGENEKINYLTAMSDIDTSSVDINFGNFFKSLSDKSGKGLSEAKDFFNKLNESYKNIDFITTLTNKGNGIVDIVMETRPKEDSPEKESDKKNTKEDEMQKMMQKMTQGVMLRGSVYENGGVHSFWVKTGQKNLISIFFELPKKEVKVGDTWQLDVNLIENDQNFICDSAYKINEVTLTEIKKVNEETIAVLKYNIVEYVKGTFNTPSYMGSGSQVTMMSFSHQAIAEFSIDKGRWISYNGIMSLDTSSGVMTGKKKTKFTLITQ